MRLSVSHCDTEFNVAVTGMSIERRPKPFRDDPLQVASVAKAFQVLDAFGHATGELGLTELAALSGLDRSATQRFAHTLWRLGYLEKNERTRRFRLGKRVLDAAFNFLRSDGLVERATPALIELRQVCGERANLSLHDDTTMIYAIRQQTRREYFASSLIGRRIPVFCTAGGRAVLSRLSEADASSIVARSDLSPLTARTICDPFAIMEKVRAAATDGFALAVEETTPGEITVGAAVMDAAGVPVAAVHIAASVADWTTSAFAERLGPLVTEAARSLSRGLQGVPDSAPRPIATASARRSTDPR